MPIGLPRVESFQHMVQLAADSFVEPDGSRDIRHHGIMALILYLVAYTGLRPSEIINLTVDDIDLNRCTVNVAGRGHNRFVPLDLFPNNSLFRLLEDYIRYCRPESDLQVLESTNKLLLHLDETPVNDVLIIFTLNQLQKKGFNFSTRFLRREFRRCLFEKGLDWEELSDITGYSVPKLKAELNVRC